MVGANNTTEGKNPMNADLRNQVISAVESADVFFPEQVCDKALEIAEAGGDWEAVIAEAKAKDQVSQ